MKILARPACSNDMNSVYLMGMDVWGVGSSAELYLNECQKSTKYQQGQWYCLENGSTLMSSLIVYKNRFKIQDKYAGFGSISTAPQQRGKGYATNLIQACIGMLTHEGCSGVYLHRETHSSIYERLGFRAVSSSEETQLMFLQIRDSEHVQHPTYF